MSSLNDRVVGNYGLSIATNQAIDGLYNRIPDRKPERPMPATLGDAVFFNVRTLFRNVWGSLPSADAQNYNANIYADIIEQEIMTIKTVLAEETPPLEAFFYLPTYASLIKDYPNGNLKDIKTDKMNQKVILENKALALLKDNPSPEIPIIFNDVEIKTLTPFKAFILSHYPVDLLHTTGFSKTFLLESHTGVVKGPDKWYTKLSTKNLEGFERIPFNKATIQFFGDSGGMFKSQPLGAKKRVAEVAIKYKWNQQTTKARMLDTLRLAGEGHIEQTMRALW